MGKLKLMTIVGTRPEIIRLSEIIKKCDKYFNHILVHTGQNWDYTLNEIFFKELGLRKPDYYLGVVGKNLGETIGNVISYSYELMLKEKPDALLVLGDTNSCLSVIAAKRLKIPIFHMEAGNRCFDSNVPEEINRKIIDVTSDVNLSYTEHARRNLLEEGISRQFTFVTGSPLPEVFEKYGERIEHSDILEKLSLQKGKYILVSAHREENIDNTKKFKKLMESLNAVAEEYSMPIIYSTHPRSLKKIREMNIKFNENIRSLKPFGFYDYNKLQKNSYSVLSDSGSLAEEAGIMKFSAISLRTSTERPEAIDKGYICLSGIDKENILNSLSHVHYIDEIKNNSIATDYSDINISTKIVNIIQGYVDIIKEVIWRNYEKDGF